MAGRPTAVGRNRRTHSHKTAKRLEIKRLMLAQKALRPSKRKLG